MNGVANTINGSKLESLETQTEAAVCFVGPDRNENGALFVMTDCPFCYCKFPSFLDKQEPNLTCRAIVSRKPSVAAQSASWTAQEGN
jgi:hypothetical protein